MAHYFDIVLRFRTRRIGVFCGYGILLVLFYLNYHYNFFGIANDNLFKNNLIDSESAVVAGIVALRTTNPIERVNREFKRRTKSMDTLGEKTLETLVAFTALRLEYGWQTRAADDVRIERMMWKKQNQIESTMESLIH